MNDLEYDYIPVELPNVFLERKKGGTLYTSDMLSVEPFISPLIQRLSKVRPKWKFVATYAPRDMVRAFNVYEDGVNLGVIHSSWTNNRGDVVEISNHRIAQKRDRGSLAITKDLKKAFKLVTSNFHKDTIDELSGKAVNTIRSAVSGKANQAKNKFESKFFMDAFARFIITHVMDNWESIQQEAMIAGIPSGVVSDIPEKYDTHITMDSLLDAMQNNQGVTVFLNEGRYIVGDGRDRLVLDNDQLPAHMKRSLGVLKLVADSTPVRDHGFRVSGDKFYITSKGE